MSLDEEDIQGRNWQEECATLAHSHVLILDRVGITEDGYRVREMENETRSRGGEREREEMAPEQGKYAPIMRGILKSAWGAIPPS